MLRGLIQSIIIHAVLLALLLLGGASLGGGRGGKNAVTLQISTYVVDKHDPGDGDAPAALNEGGPGLESSVEIAAAQDTEPEKQPEAEPKPEPKPEPKSEPKPEPKPKPKPEPVLEPVPSLEPEPEPSFEPEPVQTANESDIDNAGQGDALDADYASIATVGNNQNGQGEGLSGESTEFAGTGADGGKGTGAAQGGASDGIFSLKEVDIIPKITNDKLPEYPRYAKDNRITGYVKLGFVVDAKGRVQDLVVLEAAPENVFEKSALAAAGKWRFAPAKRGGRNVSTRIVRVLNFDLEEYK